MKQKFDITGMTCSACSARVEKCVSRLPGVEKVSVNLLTNSMQAEYEEGMLTEQGIINAVTKAGYGAFVHGETKDTGQRKGRSAAAVQTPVEQQIKDMKFRLIVSFAFLIPLMYVSMGHMAGLPLPAFLDGVNHAVSFAFTQFLLCLPIIYVNRNYYIKGYQTLMHLSPNMDSLIAIGSTASLVYGIFAIYRMSYGMGQGNMELVQRYYHDLYFESAAMILALITVGKYLESRSKGKTSEAISKLIDLAPKTAIVEREGREVQIPVDEVRAGDIVIVKPGAGIPVDGFIVEGSTSVDESAITGESMPVAKEVSDTVIAATINKTGYIRFKATRVGEDTTFSQIIRLVEEASSSKAPIAKIADKISGIFVPAVIGIALITAIAWLAAGAAFEFALSCAISVLVISCPCALGLATPVAIMVGTGKGAENGILIKSGEALETAHNIQSVVLDKTGTITRGRPEVTDVYSKKMQEDSFLAIAAGLENKSEHPLAEAILEYVKNRQIVPVEISDFQAIAGMGIQGSYQGKVYFAGNEKLMKEKNISSDGIREQLELLADQGKTPMLFADEEEVLGIIAAADVVKETSREAIEQLKKQGIEVIMLTGDNKRTAEAIRGQLNIDTVIAEVLPHEKEKEIARIQKEGKKVAMIGDGVNDAPALARADVGLAIGAGTDVAIASADIVLMKNDLMDAVTAIRLSKAVIKNIKENLFWAFFYNTLGIPVAAGVFYSSFGFKMNPMIGAAAMSVSSIFVVSNALRLKRFKVSQAFCKAQTKETEEKKTTLIHYKEEKNMITMKIEGMMCPHCQAAVTKALNAIDGVTAEVNLEAKEAYVTLSKEVSEEVLTKAVTDAGYEVVSCK